jgi:hypothetical protein
MDWIGKVDWEGVFAVLILLAALAIFVLAMTGVIPGDATTEGQPNLCVPGPTGGGAC